jgi:hypothetical protein
MEVRNKGESDRVRAQTRPAALRQIDSAIESRIRFYATQPRDAISRRIGELDREWDIERILETNASSVALAGLLLGLTRGRKYLLLTAGVLGFLLMHAVQGWCPPVPVLRQAGIRTRSEIDREKFALKILRGDFEDIHPVPAEERGSPAREVMDAVES